MLEYKGQQASDQGQPGMNWACDEEEEFIFPSRTATRNAKPVD